MGCRNLETNEMFVTITTGINDGNLKSLQSGKIAHLAEMLFVMKMRSNVESIEIHVVVLDVYI